MQRNKKMLKKNDIFKLAIKKYNKFLIKLFIIKQKKNKLMVKKY